MPDNAPASVVDVDAGILFRHPFRAMVLVTFVVGALDAIGFERFGVFTANQAGNLVIGWTLLATDAGGAGLAAASLLGCALGVAVVVVVRHVWHWLAGPMGSRILLVGAALLIGGASAVGQEVATAEELSAVGWWAQAESVALTAFSIAVLGVVFVSGGGMRAPILASTNAFVDAVRYGTASGLAPRDTQWPRRARRAGAFPLAWTAGAAAASLLPFSRILIVVGAAVLLVVTALLPRRVTPADPAGPSSV
jgi:hypothetical protein